MRAYQSFLKDAGTPIGIVGAIGLAVWLAVQAFTFVFFTPPNERAWQSECEQLAVGNIVLTDDEKMGGEHFCILFTPIEEYPILESSTSVWKAGCVQIGGVYKAWNSTLTCYRKEVVEGLGAQETYGETP